MKDLVLLHDRKILEFGSKDKKKFKHGITTVKSGDFRIGVKANSCNRANLMSYYKAERFVQLFPEHGITIAAHHARQHDYKASEALLGDVLIFRGLKEEVICMVHCSWMTLASEIIEKALTVLPALSGKKLSNFKALLYPGVCQMCYEVDEKIMKKISYKKYRKAYRQGNDREHKQLDLSKIIRMKLRELNFNKRLQQINVCSGHSCFRGNLDGEKILYSYRGRNDAKRNLIYSYLVQSKIIVSATTGNCPYLILYC